LEIVYPIRWVGGSGYTPSRTVPVHSCSYNEWTDKSGRFSQYTIQYTKFEVPSFTNYKDMIEATFKKRVMRL